MAERSLCHKVFLPTATKSAPNLDDKQSNITNGYDCEAINIFKINNHSNFISGNCVNVFHVNIQCITNKIGQLSMLLDKYNYDVVCLSEHWQTEDNLCLINLPYYKLANYYCRSASIHGGVCIYIKNNLEFKALNFEDFNCEFNSEFCGIELISQNIIIITVYRSCTGDFNYFLDAFENILTRLLANGRNIIIVGDFNVNFMINSANVNDILCLINSFNLRITIKDYTRITQKSSTCIDNVITNIDEVSVL